MDIDDIYRVYEERKATIHDRLESFRALRDASDERLFEELCFCTLTANTSAAMGIESIELIRDILLEGSREELTERLKGTYRFYNRRPEYIVHNRRYLMEEHGFELRSLLDSFEDTGAARAYLVEFIKGVGWKEASHFLRNVGFLDVAILDKHVLRCLASLDVTDAERPTTGAVYMEKEEALHDFAASLDIPFAALDLVLWSSQTGEVLK